LISIIIFDKIYKNKTANALSKNRMCNPDLFFSQFLKALSPILRDFYHLTHLKINFLTLKLAKNY